MNEWNIQSRAHGCQACGRHFVDKHPYHTLLVDERRQVSRIDLCEACWSARQEGRGGAPEGFISHWQGTYEVPPPAPPEPIKKESAETLLRRIMELSDPSYAAASYILAVMLERKRVLKVKEQFKREGRRIFVYEHPKTADVFTIADPELQLNQLDQVQRDVAHLLEHGLPGDSPAGGASQPAASAGESASATAGTDASVDGEATPDDGPARASAKDAGPAEAVASEPVSSQP